MASLPGNFNIQEFADAGAPLVNGRLYTYAYGTTTQKTAYTDAAGTIPHTYTSDGAGGQYIALNARGELPAPLYLTSGAYDLSLKRSDGSTVWTRRADAQASASDLAASSGASNVGFIAAGANAVPRDLQSKARELAVSITDYGGLDNDTFDNAAAFTAAKTAVGAGGTIRFPKTNAAASYYFASDPDISGVVLDVDPLVQFRGPFSLYSTIKTVRDFKVRVTSQNYNYRPTPQNKKPYAEKTLYLTDGDIDNSVVSGIDVSTSAASHEKVTFPTGDTWVSASADKTAVADQVAWNNTLTDGVLRASFVGVRAGDEVSVSFLDGVYRRAAVIRTTNGYYVVYADANGSSPHLTTKLLSVAATDAAFTYNGSTKAQYYPENSVWTIRIYDRNRFSVLFNGLEVTGVQTVSGEIVDAGFGVQGLSGTSTYYVNAWAQWRNSPIGGKRDITILCVGDSLTADIHGGWPYAAAEALENSFGIRVNNVINQAVSGANSTSQLSLLTSNGTQGASHVFICIGTNDIQFSGSAATLISNIDSMITLCNSNFATPIVWIPPLWYSQADASGDGQNTAGIGLGSDHRARIMRLCANRGVKCVNMLQATGPILASYLASTTADPFVRDNIHPTTYGYRIIGYRLARALAGAYIPRAQRAKALTPLIGTYANGWAAGAEPPYYAVSSDGTVSMAGYISGGTVTNGTVMFTLPKHLRPQVNGRFACANSNTTPCVVNVNTDGTMTLYNAAGATYVALDSIRYETGG